MSGGRWIKDPDGNYVHYTDEEYDNMQRDNNFGRAGCATLIAGAVIFYLLCNDVDWKASGIFWSIVVIIGAALFMGLLNGGKIVDAFKFTVQLIVVEYIILWICKLFI